ncbi:hypothetical protein NPIL_236101 [Nephila pilipes]|uniref:Uncharacterized protein n=1 Tax=Nephila pilipes TaxID=299642 RepID=A0A8X6QDN9_NEPPI|nr:hypothetical protein NPIL_236101 [Nephila pilipes]
MGTQLRLLKFKLQRTKLESSTPSYIPREGLARNQTAMKRAFCECLNAEDSIFYSHAFAGHTSPPPLFFLCESLFRLRPG